MQFENYPDDYPEINKVNPDLIPSIDMSNTLSPNLNNNINSAANSDINKIDLSVLKDPKLFNIEIEENYNQVRDNILGAFCLSNLDNFRENLDSSHQYSSEFAIENEAYLINDFVDRIDLNGDKIPSSVYEELYWISSLDDKDYKKYREFFNNLTIEEIEIQISNIFDGKIQNNSKNKLPVEANKELSSSEMDIIKHNEITEKYKILEELQDSFKVAEAEYFKLKEENESKFFSKVFRKNKKELREAKEKCDSIKKLIIIHTSKSN